MSDALETYVQEVLPLDPADMIDAAVADALAAQASGVSIMFERRLATRWVGPGKAEICTACLAGATMLRLGVFNRAVDWAAGVDEQFSEDDYCDACQACPDGEDAVIELCPSDASRLVGLSDYVDRQLSALNWFRIGKVGDALKCLCPLVRTTSTPGRKMVKLLDALATEWTKQLGEDPRGFLLSPDEDNEVEFVLCRLPLLAEAYRRVDADLRRQFLLFAKRALHEHGVS
jgi:hypothetical protein